MKKYPNEIVGAIIPVLCTLDSVLKPVDYQEIYDALSDIPKKSIYGKSILESAQK